MRFRHIQGSRIRFVLGCVIPRAGAVARSRNLGQALFGSPILRHTCVYHPKEVRNESQHLCNSAKRIDLPKNCHIRKEARKGGSDLRPHAPLLSPPPLSPIARATAQLPPCTQSDQFGTGSARDFTGTRGVTIPALYQLTFGPFWRFQFRIRIHPWPMDLPMAETRLFSC